MVANAAYGFARNRGFVGSKQNTKQTPLQKGLAKASTVDVGQAALVLSASFRLLSAMRRRRKKRKAKARAKLA